MWEVSLSSVVAAVAAASVVPDGKVRRSGTEGTDSHQPFGIVTVGKVAGGEELATGELGALVAGEALEEPLGGGVVGRDRRLDEPGAGGHGRQQPPGELLAPLSGVHGELPDELGLWLGRHAVPETVSHDLAYRVLHRAVS